MNARVVGLVAVTAVAAVAVGAALAPVAQSGSSPGLKLTTRNSERTTLRPNSRRTITARCPRGSHVTGMGQEAGGFDLAVLEAEKRNARSAAMTFENLGTQDAVVAVQVLCAEGAGGFRIADDSTGFRF